MQAAVEEIQAQVDLLVAGVPYALALLGLVARERQALVELGGLKQAGGTQALTLEGLQRVREMQALVSADQEGWQAELPALTGPKHISAAALVVVSLREPQAQVV